MFLTSCSYKSIPIENKWYPLTKIVERPDIPFVSPTLTITIANKVFVTDLEEWVEEHPPKSFSRQDTLAHEYVHAYRQNKYGLFVWLTLYSTNQNFKRKEEQLAYYVSIKRKMLRNEKVDIKHYVKSMSTHYFGMMDEFDATLWVIEVITGLWTPDPGDLPDHPEIPR